MYQALMIVHMLAAIAMIGSILLQQGRGATAGVGGLGGGGSSSSVFGAQGSASFLTRVTAICATVFFSTSLTLSVLSGSSKEETTDILDDIDMPVLEQSIPAQSLDDEIPAPIVENIPNAADDQPVVEQVIDTVTEQVEAIEIPQAEINNQ